MSSANSSQAVRSSLYHRVSAWLERHARLVMWGSVALTALLVIPLAVMEPRGEASQDPSGRVFDLQERIDNSFSSPSHYVPFIAESRTGDILTPDGLSELLLNETRLRAADERGELAPEGLPERTYLLEYYDTATGATVDGLVTIADAVEQELRASSGGALSLFEATEEQVKDAVHRVLANPSTGELRETLSVEATAEPRVVNGEEILWWESPAVVFGVTADNALLGGGTQTIGVGADEGTLDKEEFNRNVQEVLRGDEETYRLWGIAIDVNLESADQGQASGLFITLTVIAAIIVVGVALRSYWAVALTGAGLGALMVWLKGFSLLIGLKSGLVIDLIVPIAMISLGVDYTVHTVRRYQEERGAGLPYRRALVTGLGSVIPALLLVMLSDGFAFLSNATGGIESVIHFGIAATIAVASAFVVLGLVVPVALYRIEAMRGAHGARSRGAKAWGIAASAGAAAGAGGAVILMVAVSPVLGAAVLAAVFASTVLLPLGVLKLRSRRQTVVEEAGPNDITSPVVAAAGTGNVARFMDWLNALTRYRYAVLLLFAGVTAASVLAALRLDATFDVKDFFASDSDFVVSLDKLDQHVADRSGEPASVLVEGNFSDIAALSAIQAVFDNLDANGYVGRDSAGVVNISTPNILQIVRDITTTEYSRQQVEALTGVTLSDRTPYGFPATTKGVRAVLDYAVQAGVPAGPGELAYTPEDVRSVLRHNPAGGTLDLTRFTVFLPGTREQSTVAAAHEALEEDLQSLEGARSITEYGLTGSPLLRQAQLEATTNSLQTSIPLSAAASLLLLLVAFRSIRFAIVTIIPIGLVVAWLYAVMYISGFALNFVTATIGAISIGVGIDYSIHLTERFREELRRTPSRAQAMRDALRGTGVALAGSAVSSIAGFAIMGFAPMPLFSSYGILTALMIFFALAASLLVLPSLLIIATSERRAKTVTEKAASSRPGDVRTT